MANNILKAIAFMFIFNISVGILNLAFPMLIIESGESSLFYNDSMGILFTNGMEEPISPEADLEDAGDQGYRLIDLSVLGFIKQGLSVLKGFLYGFTDMLDNIFGSYIARDNIALYNFLFTPVIGVFYLINTIGYIYAGYYLWTGKDLSGED